MPCLVHTKLSPNSQLSITSHQKLFYLHKLLIFSNYQLSTATVAPWQATDTDSRLTRIVQDAAMHARARARLLGSCSYVLYYYSSSSSTHTRQIPNWHLHSCTLLWVCLVPKFFSKLLTFHHIKPFIYTQLFSHIVFNFN